MKLRPHHFLCTLSFKGKGYSKEFIKKFYAIKKYILANPEKKIRVSMHEDSICESCPHFRIQSCNFQETKIKKLDFRHSEALKLKHDDRVSWNEILHRMKTSSFQLSDICQGCEWLSYGICEQTLHDLRNDSIKEDISSG